MLLWNLNVRSASAAWETLNLVSLHKIHVATLQEVRLSPNDYTAFARYAHNLGYCTHHAAGPTTTDRWSNNRSNGGILTIIRRSIKQAHSFTVSSHGGQAVAVWIDGILCTNIYAAHHEEQQQFLSELYSDFRCTGFTAPFICIGDWNAEPHENSLASMIELHGGVCVSPGLPTRWDGDRVIDYPVTNIEKHFEVCLTDHALSDHRLIQLTIDHTVSHVPQTSPQPTQKYQPPDTITVDTWKEMIETTWTNQEWNFHGTIKSQAHCNELWNNLMVCVEQSFRQACVNVQNEYSQPRNFNSRNSKYRPKGSAAKVVTMAGQTKHPDRFLPATRIRQLRNVLARLRELRLYELRGEYHPQKEHILSKCAHVVSLPDTPTNKQIQHVEELIRKFHHDQKLIRINEWKNRRRHSPASVYSWLKGSSEVISSQIHLNDDEASQSMPEALNKVRCYWRSVWDTRQHSTTDCIQKCLETLGAPTPIAQWEPITAAELHSAALRQKGRAAGLDGFSGTEVSHLPVKFWTDVVHLFQEFERSGVSPEAWNNIKQVHLPKPNKGKRARDGATDAASMRPICILSVWFRIHASPRFKSTSVQRWLDTWWPAEAYGGRRCKSIDDALLQIQYHAEQRKYIGAFDYSLAFDMVDPKIALEIFKHLLDGLDSSMGCGQISIACCNMTRKAVPRMKT